MTDEELQAFVNHCKRIASIIVDFAEKEALK
jgi:phosphopantetheinyl transferase (holo-ACP synthase)